jgi:hypothetical protein
MASSLRHSRSVLELTVAACVFAGALAGCGALLGAGDYKVEEGDAAIDDGTAPDVARFDAGGSLPEAGGEAEAEAEASVVTCGSTIAVSSPTLASMVEACVLAASCDPGCFEKSISDCVSEDYLNSIQAKKCYATIKSCTDYANCSGETIPDSTQCPTSTSPAQCLGNTAVNCGVDNIAGNYTLACGDAGSQCGTYDDPQMPGTRVASCTLGGCDGGTDGLLHCDSANNLYTCVNGVAYGQSCAAQSSRCVDDPVNGPTCEPNGASCSALMATCSSATTAQDCINNVTYGYDCAAAGLSCRQDPQLGALCLAPGCTVADYNNCVETCDVDGHTAHLCVGGVGYAVDCQSYGFKSCDDSLCNFLYCSY